MGKIKLFIEKYRTVFNVLLFILAVTMGGGVMAAGGIEEPPTEPTAKGGDTDPADPETNDLHTPGDGAAGQNLNGTQASSTQERKSDNVDEEWDSGVTRFQAWKTPFLALTRLKARTVKINNWTVSHARIGGDTLDATTVNNIAAANTITIAPADINGNIANFYAGTTILVPSIKGYKYGSPSEQSGCLMLYVKAVDVATKAITCLAINGPMKQGETDEDILENHTVPAIPAGTYICAGAAAGSETQLLITPENYHPRKETFYVQKKLLNIQWSNDFEKIKKKQPWKIADIKANAMFSYNMRAERTYWWGSKSRFSVTLEDGSIEDVYTSEGTINQVTNSYALPEKVKVGDLIALSMLQHTTFSQNDHSYAFCGRKAMAKLLQVDLGDSKNVISITDFTDGELKIDFKRLRTTFGVTDFTYDQGLDMLGLEECIIILDLEGATRYVKISEKSQTNDLSKGAGVVRDAKREMHQEADCIALRGYNSIIAGPADVIYGLPNSDKRTDVVSAPELPAKPTVGQIIALTADYTVGEGASATTYEAGSVLEYTAKGWVPYTGYTTAG